MGDFLCTKADMMPATRRATSRDVNPKLNDKPVTNFIGGEFSSKLCEDIMNSLVEDTIFEEAIDVCSPISTYF